jgi:signal transduction histidine kinase
VLDVAMKKPVQKKRQPATVDLGIAGLRIPVHSHAAYLWENEQDFAEALGFLAAGLRSTDYCVVIGDRQDTERMLAILKDRGIDVEGFKVRQRLSFIERGPRAEATLKEIAATFEVALASGAPVVRLIGNVGWSREAATTDSELLLYEARLTEIAERFPAVILCLHEVQSMTGMILRHGVLGTHPRVVEEGGVLGNPYFVPLDRFLARIGVIAGDLAERQRQREALQRSNEELRALSVRLQDVREEESSRISREVHDEVGQMLTALSMDVAWMEGKLKTYSPAVRDELVGKLRSMSQLVDTTMSAVQRIVTELRPSVLDELGLDAAIEGYVTEFQQRTGIRCRFRSRLGGADLEPARSTALFRIVQEALTNVARHAGATAVEIRLAADAGRIVLEVADNGRGIPEDKVADSRSLGLVGMRERTRSQGGELTVRRAPGEGTTVEVTLPP